MGVSVVRSVLSAESIQAHRFRYWKDSPDPEFEPKMLAVVGLYLAPPQNAVVLSVDEKTSIQALDRTQPRLPLKPHRIERLSHEYRRHGTASLLASLEVHSGQVRVEPIRRNNSATFIRFLRRLLNAYPDKDLYVIADNGSSHRSKKTRAWVARQKRLHLTFTLTHALENGREVAAIGQQPPPHKDKKPRATRGTPLPQRVTLWGGCGRRRR